MICLYDVVITVTSVSTARDKCLRLSGHCVHWDTEKVFLVSGDT